MTVFYKGQVLSTSMNPWAAASLVETVLYLGAQYRQGKGK